jgi:putative ABC transport system ATP-binding protein
MPASSEQMRDKDLHYLEVRSLKKAFSMRDGTKLPVVDVPTFNLRTGQQLAIFGKSGSGKSTFLNLLAGILKANSGSIKIDNTDLTELPESGRDLIRSRVMGYVFQSFHLLQGCTALENVLVTMAVNGNANEDEAKELLSLVDMSERENSLPSQLSIGQQQRVGIARALANSPKLILADEPTGSLDPENASRSIELLKSLCKANGCALIVVSHDPNTINCFEHSMKWEDLNKAGKEDK